MNKKNTPNSSNNMEAWFKSDSRQTLIFKPKYETNTRQHSLRLSLFFIANDVMIVENDLL